MFPWERSHLTREGNIMRSTRHSPLRLLPLLGLLAALLLPFTVALAPPASAAATEDTVADPVRLTVSSGVVGTLEVPHEPDSLVALADAALYRAKHDGRGRVFVA